MDIPQCRPEAEGPFTDDHFRRDQPPYVLPNQQNPPVPGNPALLIGADDHQHALSVPIETRLELDVVGPQMDVALG